MVDAINRRYSRQKKAQDAAMKKGDGSVGSSSKEFGASSDYFDSLVKGGTANSLSSMGVKIKGKS